MGNCCIRESKLSHIQTEDKYYKCVLSNLKRVQEIIQSFSEKNKSSKNVLGESASKETDDWKEKYMSYEKEQFYLMFGNVLLQMKMIMEEEYYNNNHVDEDNNDDTNQSKKNFNPETAVPFLEDLLLNEDIGDKSKLNLTKENIAKNIFTSNK